LATTRRLDRRAAGPPVHAYESLPGVPAVSIARLDRNALEGADPDHAHSHDFLLLAYYERGGGSLRIGDRHWGVEPGDAYVIAPGEVVGVGDDPGGLAEAEGWAVYFPPEGLGTQAPDALLAWRAHPLLFPFARGAASGAQRLTVPATDRRAYSLDDHHLAPSELTAAVSCHLRLRLQSLTVGPLLSATHILPT